MGLYYVMVSGSLCGLGAAAVSVIQLEVAALTLAGPKTRALTRTDRGCHGDDLCRGGGCRGCCCHPHCVTAVRSRSAHHSPGMTQWNESRRRSRISTFEDVV